MISLSMMTGASYERRVHNTNMLCVAGGAGILYRPSANFVLYEGLGFGESWSGEYTQYFFKNSDPPTGPTVKTPASKVYTKNTPVVLLNFGLCFLIGR
jgi:hypothetical protein